MLLSHDDLMLLIATGVVEHAKHDAVNAASIDIHLGSKIMVEWETDDDHPLMEVDYSKRQRPAMREYAMTDEGYVLQPGEFILAQSVEVFNLPNHLSAEYKLKSSMARIGLEHMNAGWCDAGWHGSVLTLEFKNMTNHHAIRIRPGDAIGQMIFFRHAAVPINKSYAARGRYNNDKSVSTIRE
jgi:dCTP deaminase